MSESSPARRERDVNRARILFFDIRDHFHMVSDMFDRPSIVLACGRRLSTLYRHRLEDQAPNWGVELTPHPERVSTVDEARAILAAMSTSLDVVNDMPPDAWWDDPYLPRFAYTTTYAYLTALPNVTALSGGGI